MARYDDEVFEPVETDPTETVEEVEQETTGLEEVTEETNEDLPEEETVETEEDPTEKETSPEEPLDDVDNPKSYKHFQRLAEERYQHNRRLEQELEALKQSQGKVDKDVDTSGKPSLPTESVTPLTEPIKPDEYDEVDALTDQSSSSYKYNQELQAYQLNKIKLLEQTVQKVEQERQRAEEERIIAANRNKILSSFQQVGLTQTQSEKALQFFTSPESVDPAIMGKFYQWYDSQQNGSPMPKARPKLNDVVPPGVTPGGTERISKTPDDLFNDQLKTGQRDWGI